MNAKYRAFTVAALGSFLATFESSAVNVALPTLSEHFGSPLSEVSWVALAYTLTIAPSLLVFATLARDGGVKKMYHTGFTLFALGCVISSFANSLGLVIVGRIAQGFGGSMIMSVGPAVITHAFPPNERGKGMGLIGMVVGAGLLSGPALGGFLVSVWGWRSIFVAPLPITILGFALVSWVKEWRPVASVRPKVNYISGLLFFVGLGSFLYALKIFNESAVHWGSLFSLAGLALLAVTLFFVREKFPSTRLVGLSIFRHRNFSVSVAAMLCVFMASSATFILVPFYVERQLGESARVAGLCLAIAPLILASLAALVGRLSDRIGSRIPTISGLIVSTIGLFLLRGIEPSEGLGAVIIPLIVYGVGMSLFGTPNSSDLMGSVDTNEREVASGILATTRTLAISFGVAISSALFTYWAGDAAANLSGNGATLVAFRNVFTAAALVSTCALVIVQFRGERRR